MAAPGRDCRRNRAAADHGAACQAHADAIVLRAREGEDAAAALQLPHRLGGVRVAHDVAQRFLEDAEQQLRVPCGRVSQGAGSASARVADTRAAAVTARPNCHSIASRQPPFEGDHRQQAR